MNRMNYNNMNCRSNASRCDNMPRSNSCRDNTSHANTPYEMMPRNQVQQGYTPHKHSSMHDCVEIPTGNRKRLLSFINEVSFAVDDTLLYLDTHPDCEEALCYFHKYNHLRNHALAEYEKEYGPLVIASADDSCRQSWEWMSQPWPWEGGLC